MNLGSTILQLRKQKGLNQGELAAKLQISQTYLSQIEKNKKIPNISLLEKIGVELSTALPFIFFLSLDEKDVPASKLEFFKMIEPSVKKFIGELIN